MFYIGGRIRAFFRVWSPVNFPFWATGPSPGPGSGPGPSRREARVCFLPGFVLTANLLLPLAGCHDAARPAGGPLTESHKFQKKMHRSLPTEYFTQGADVRNRSQKNSSAESLGSKSISEETDIGEKVVLYLSQPTFRKLQFCKFCLGQIAHHVGGALLNLSDSALSSLSAVMQSLPSLRTFRRLDLSRNEVVSLRSLCGLPMLERLDVSNNRSLN
jgi:hypothetical protein